MKRLFKFDTMFGNLRKRRLSIWLLSCFLLTGGGCTTEEPSQSDYPQRGAEYPIVFLGGDLPSRALVTSAVRKIGVFGYSHEGSFADAFKVPDYFLNQAVIDKDNNGSWSYSGVTKYWPREGINVSFLAYSPYIDVENTFEIYPSNVSNTGTPTITYTVPSNIYDQVDLLWSNALNKTYTNSNHGQVELAMAHALTRVDFRIKLDDKEKERPYIVTINKLMVQNIIGSGVLDLSKSPGDAMLWSTTRPANNSGWASYTLTPDNGGGLQELVFDTRTTSVQKYDPFANNNMFTTGQYLMLIPQRINNQSDGLTPAQITLSYSFTNVYSGETTQREEVLPLSQTALSEWKAGQGIIYQMNLSLVSGTTVDLDIEGFLSGTPWEDVNSTNPITGSVN